ncbi:MAG: hypothetical protein ASARMPREDX12_001304 [Alectoria sarmentosa]|nr:MAG: hypothetical protein ASARMPREDX12_001304 [Alectoria sarmentosa]
MAGRGGLDSILRYAVSGVAGGIGLASESIHARKERKKAKSFTTEKSNNNPIPPQESSTSTPTSLHEEGADEEVIIEQEDEKEWDLDDAQTGLPGGASSDDEPSEYTLGEPSAPKKSKADSANITEAFLKRYPPPAPTDDAQSLPLPVILPQRRPKDRTRGFIRAYAPELEMRGIDQAMFLDFLQTFEKASEANPWINAINLAGIAASFIPDGFGVGLADSNQRLPRQDERRIYRPRGLYCLVMTWTPESSETSSAFDLTFTISVKSKSNPSGQSNFAKRFSNSSGKTYADMEFPEVAPLIFPALDNLAEQRDKDAARKRDKLKKKAKFVDDYWDKRAQAKYAGISILRLCNREEALEGASGVYLEALGEVQLEVMDGTKRGYDRSGWRMGDRMGSGERIQMQQGAGKGGQDYTQRQTDAHVSAGREVNTHGGFSDGRRGMGGGLGLGSGPLGLPLPTPQMAIKKLLKKDVLYLMIVNMPSEAEMAAAMAATGRWKGRDEKARVDSQSLRFFEFGAEAWRWDLCDAIQGSLFARFLHSIGHRNATCLKTLRFIVDEPDDNEETPEIEQMIEVIMTLLKHHTCSLSDLEIILNTENDQSYWDIDEEAPTQPCRNLNGPTQFPTVEEAIYDALKEPIQQLPGLKNLHFEGFGRDPFINEELVKFERDVVGYPSNGGADLTSSSPPLHLSPLVELTKLQ